VCKQLRNLGYEVTTQVGMSGYRIDLAIVDPNDASKYILGIECDGAMSHSPTTAKEIDIYRQRFMERRGWTIERIWSGIGGGILRRKSSGLIGRIRVGEEWGEGREIN
jgi:very-short-patch-repair endonuclease